MTFGAWYKHKLHTLNVFKGVVTDQTKRPEVVQNEKNISMHAIFYDNEAAWEGRVDTLLQTLVIYCRKIWYLTV